MLMQWILRFWFPGLVMTAFHLAPVRLEAPPAENPLTISEQFEPDPVLTDLIADYDRYFSEALSQTQTPGAAVVIVHEGRILMAKGYGLRAAGLPDSVDEHTLFRIGSLSKGFAGVLSGMLVTEGFMAWDEPVRQRNPAFCLQDPKQAERVQIKHILSHSSGLPYHAFTDLIERGFDIPTITHDYFPKLKLFGKEGERFSYQNAAICAVENIMLAATGKQYARLLKEKIFDPAGMRTASCDYESMHLSANKALPHAYTGWSFTPDSISTRYYNALAAGGVNASAADMGAWLRLLLGHEPSIVSESTLDEVFRPFIRSYGERRYFGRWPGPKEAYYAMGWRVLCQESDTIICHSGYVNGYKSDIALNRNDGIGICVLMNAHTDLSAQCLPEFFNRWRARRSAIQSGAR